MDPIILIPFATVGQLRHAMEGIPNDTPLLAQVEAPGGLVWAMNADFCPVIPGGLGAAILLTPLVPKAPTPDIIIDPAATLEEVRGTN